LKVTELGDLRGGAGSSADYRNRKKPLRGGEQDLFLRGHSDLRQRARGRLEDGSEWSLPQEEMWGRGEATEVGKTRATKPKRDKRRIKESPNGVGGGGRGFRRRRPAWRNRIPGSAISSCIGKGRRRVSQKNKGEVRKPMPQGGRDLLLGCREEGRSLVTEVVKVSCFFRRIRHVWRAGERGERGLERLNERRGLSARGLHKERQPSH